MGDWLDKLPLPQAVKNLIVVAFVVAVATTFANGKANEVLQAAKSAKEAAEDAEAEAKNATQAAKKASEKAATEGAVAAGKLNAQDRRIIALETAVMAMKEQWQKQGVTEQKVRDDLSTLKTKISNMEGTQQAQFAAILRALERLDKQAGK